MKKNIFQKFENQTGAYVFTIYLCRLHVVKFEELSTEIYREIFKMVFSINPVFF